MSDPNPTPPDPEHPQPAQPQYAPPGEPQYAPPAEPQPYGQGDASRAPQYAPYAPPAYAQPQPAYAQPQPAYAPQYAQATAAPPTNVLAVISMISSIVGVFFWGIFAVAGVIMGHIALSQIKKRGEGGRGMAVAGLIVGYVAIGVWLLIAAFLLIVAFGFLATAGSASYS